MISLDAVLLRLHDVRKVGQSAWFARCPCHEDRGRPNLSVRVAPGSPPYAAHCFGCGAGTRAVLAALGLGNGPQSHEDAPGSTRTAPAMPEEGSPVWWDMVHSEALDLARRQPWYDPELMHWRARIDDLHHAAERLGPDDPAAWTMLAEAAALEHEFRLLDQTMVPGLGW